MVERLIFIPEGSWSQASCQTIPFYRAILDELTSVFDAEVFASPIRRGVSKYPPTWQGWVRALQEALVPGCHVVAETTWVPHALEALSDRAIDAQSLTAIGFLPSPATLRALEQPAMADTLLAITSSWGRTAAVQAYLGRGVSEEEARRLADLWQSEVDGSYFASLIDSWSRWNQVRHAPTVSVPVLYIGQILETVEWMGSWDDQRKDFLRFVPHAEVQEMPQSNLADDAAGQQRAERIIAFIERCRGQTVPVRA